MLLSVLGQYNTRFRRVAMLGVIGACLLLETAIADEVRQWRDADGKLHVKIIGDGEPVDPDAAGMPLLSTTELTPEEKFSVRTSLHRRAIENGVKRASAEVARLDGEIAETEGKEFVVYTPPTARSPEEAQFLLDSQRNAFLAARRFEQDRSDHLRKLRRERRDRLLDLRDLWKDFDILRGEVLARYGQPPGWWRDRIECEGCVSRAEIDQMLAPRDGRDERERRAEAADAKELEEANEEDDEETVDDSGAEVDDEPE